MHDALLTAKAQLLVNANSAHYGPTFQLQGREIGPASTASTRVKRTARLRSALRITTSLLAESQFPSRDNFLVFFAAK